MSALTNYEKKEAVESIGWLIRSSGKKTQVLKSDKPIDEFGETETHFKLCFSIPIEINYTPQETLSGRIDALASVLPNADIQAGNHLKIDNAVYKIQTIEPVIFLM